MRKFLLPLLGFWLRIKISILKTDVILKYKGNQNLLIHVARALDQGRNGKCGISSKTVLKP